MVAEREWTRDWWDNHVLGDETMKKDPAIQDIREVRHRISARYGHDTQALLKHYKEIEKRFAGRILKQEHPLVREKVLT